MNWTQECAISLKRNFHQIRIRFDQSSVQELFGGGKRYANWMRMDILEAGIRIISSPGQLQNMMQLSGGESPTTAAFLLFAIRT